MVGVKSGFAGLMPSYVKTEHAHIDSSDEHLFTEEAALVAKAVPKRRAEFATVRRCARLALIRLGLPPAPILNGPNREPLWPEGVVGSLTHCEDFRAAAVANANEVCTLGIDAEIHEPLPEGAAKLIASRKELIHLRQLAGAQPGIAWDRLLFSAKESIYKAWFPVARSWLDFDQCELMLHPFNSTFSGRILDSNASANGRTIKQLNGRWRLHGSHLLTAVWVPAEKARGKFQSARVEGLFA